jgi:hypothetical protein
MSDYKRGVWIGNEFIGHFEFLTSTDNRRLQNQQQRNQQAKNKTAPQQENKVRIQKNRPDAQFDNFVITVYHLMMVF